MPFKFTYDCPNEDCEAPIACAIIPGEADCPDACPKCATPLDRDAVYMAGAELAADRQEEARAR